MQGSNNKISKYPEMKLTEWSINKSLRGKFNKISSTNLIIEMKKKFSVILKKGTQMNLETIITRLKTKWILKMSIDIQKIQMRKNIQVMVIFMIQGRTETKK